MATLLLKVESSRHLGRGLALMPTVPLDTLTGRKDLPKYLDAAPVELRLPDGTRRKSRIVKWGALVTQGPNGELYVRGNERGPQFDIRFELAAELTPEEVPPGTEVWVLNPGEEEKPR